MSFKFIFSFQINNQQLFDIIVQVVAGRKTKLQNLKINELRNIYSVLEHVFQLEKINYQIMKKKQLVEEIQFFIASIDQYQPFLSDQVEYNQYYFLLIQKLKSMNFNFQDQNMINQFKINSLFYTEIQRLGLYDIQESQLIKFIAPDEYVEDALKAQEYYLKMGTFDNPEQKEQSNKNLVIALQLYRQNCRPAKIFNEYYQLMEVLFNSQIYKVNSLPATFDARLLTHTNFIHMPQLNVKYAQVSLCKELDVKEIFQQLTKDFHITSMGYAKIIKDDPQYEEYKDVQIIEQFNTVTNDDDDSSEEDVDIGDEQIKIKSVITMNSINYPVRFIQCRHFNQICELNDIIIQYKETGQLMCPICQKQYDSSQLKVDALGYFCIIIKKMKNIIQIQNQKFVVQENKEDEQQEYNDDDDDEHW